MRLSSISLVVLAAACSRSQPTPPASKSEAPSAAAIASEEQVCDLLTNDAVTAELHVPVTSRRLPKAGEYGAPSCGWFASDDPKAPGVTVVLFFHPETPAPEIAQSFSRKLDTVCRAGRTEVAGVGDEAMNCGRLWVRKGSAYFSVGPMNGDAAIDWKAADERLARHVLDRLP